MKDRFFLDTNIFVYSFDQSAPAKARIAEKLIDKAISSGKGITSYQVVQEFLNVALRRFAAPMKTADAEHYLKNVLLPLVAIYPSQSLYLEALELQSRNKISWYDSLIVASAVQAQCSLLFSEDLQNGRNFGPVRIENPFA